MKLKILFETSIEEIRNQFHTFGSQKPQTLLTWFDNIIDKMPNPSFIGGLLLQAKSKGWLDESTYNMLKRKNEIRTRKYQREQIKGSSAINKTEEDEQIAPTCSVCGVKISERTAKNSKFKHGQGWFCPDCRY
jgi:hypothetical protein